MNQATACPTPTPCPNYLNRMGVVFFPEAFWSERRSLLVNRYDFQPSVIFINRITRQSPAPLSLGLGATPRLVAQVLAGKYCDHLPFYRQQGIFLRRYGVDFPGHTFCHWTDISADLCEPFTNSSTLDCSNRTASGP